MARVMLRIIALILLAASSLTAAQDSKGKIAFYSNRSGRDDIYMMDDDGTIWQRLTFGLTIFFQGDYKSDSPADIDYLLSKCDTVDIAFLGAHPRRWGEASARIMDMMKRLNPKIVFPMHYGGKEQTYNVFAEECRERGLPYVIECPEKPGDMFHYPHAVAP